MCKLFLFRTECDDFDRQPSNFYVGGSFNTRFKATVRFIVFEYKKEMFCNSWTVNCKMWNAMLQMWNLKSALNEICFDLKIHFLNNLLKYSEAVKCDILSVKHHISYWK